VDKTPQSAAPPSVSNEMLSEWAKGDGIGARAIGEHSSSVLHTSAAERRQHSQT